MTRIIFDTNAARDFVGGVTLDDVEKYAFETAQTFQQKGLCLLLSPVVIQELLYHLVDDTDRDFSVSYKAIKAMMLVAEHLRKDDHYEMISASELLIAHEIYQMRSESRELMYSQLMSLAALIAHRGINEIPDLHTVDGGTVKTYVDDIENEFAGQIREMCGSLEMLARESNKSFEEMLNSPQGEHLLVMYFSRTTYHLLMNEGKLPNYRAFLPQYVPYTPERARQCSRFFQFVEHGNKEIARRYPAFLKLMKEVVRRIHQSQNQISDDKLKNYVWDISLMFHVNDHTVGHEPFRFITSDKTMLLASGAFHDSNNVMTFQEFRAWVGM